MNGLFTLVGGFAGMLISMAIGFTMTVYLALGLYACAFALFGFLRAPLQTRLS
jgi:small basic protein